MGITTIHSFQIPGAKSALALLAKRSYLIRPNAKPEPMREHLPFVEQPVYAESINQDAGPRLVLDSDYFCAQKQYTDVLISGSAYSPGGPVSELFVFVSISRSGALPDIHKKIRVSGDRRILLERGGRLAFSKPELFVSMDLGMDRAFGGRDAYAEDKLSMLPSAFGRSRKGLQGLREDPKNPKEDGFAISYPRNISGRGFGLDMDRERFLGRLLPNLDDPEDPVTPERLLIQDPLDWMDLPSASSFCPIDAFTFPRALFMLPHAANAPKKALYEFKKNIISKADLEDKRTQKIPPNPRLYNCAPAGLASIRLEGNERVVLGHMHPRYAQLSFDLPAERPRMLIEPPGCAVKELQPLLQTLLIEPDAMRFSLVWAGVMETAARFPKELASSIRHAAIFE